MRSETGRFQWICAHRNTKLLPSFSAVSPWFIRLRGFRWDRNFLLSVIYFARVVLSSIGKEDGNKRDVAWNLF